MKCRAYDNSEEICGYSSVLEPDNCPTCGLHFNDWFFWPGKGNYCWPCYYQKGRIYVQIQERETHNAIHQEISAQVQKSITLWKTLVKKMQRWICASTVKGTTGVSK